MGVEGAYLNLLKVISNRSTANIVLNSEKMKAFPLRSGTRQGYPLMPLSFNIVSEVPARVIRQKKNLNPPILERKK